MNIFYLVFGCLYACLIVFLSRKFILIRRSFYVNESKFFQDRLEAAMAPHIKLALVRHLLTSEISMLYYCFFSWRKNAPIDGYSFTFHKKTSVVAFYLMLIHALLLESIGFHYLLHRWNEWVAYGLLVLNLYTIVFFIGYLRAVLLSPFRVTDEAVWLQVGLAKRLRIPMEEIVAIRFYDGPEELPRSEASEVFDAVLADFAKEKASLELVFKSPLEAIHLYGVKKQVNRAILRPDDTELFFKTVESRLMNERDLTLTSTLNAKEPHHQMGLPESSC